MTEFWEQGLKPRLTEDGRTARLKSCPDTKRRFDGDGVVLSHICENRADVGHPASSGQQGLKAPVD